MENVIVVGASSNEERYSNKAMKMLSDYRHTPIPVAPKDAEILGRTVYASVAAVPGPVDTVTLYVGPQRQDGLFEHHRQGTAPRHLQPRHRESRRIRAPARRRHRPDRSLHAGAAAHGTVLRRCIRR